EQGDLRSLLTRSNPLPASWSRILAAPSAAESGAVAAQLPLARRSDGGQNAAEWTRHPTKLTRPRPSASRGTWRRRGARRARRSPAQAGELFRTAKRTEGERRARAQRGKVLYTQGDWKNSRAAFRAALDLDGKEPEPWRLHHAMARAYEKEGRKGDAERSYQKA